MDCNKAQEDVLYLSDERVEGEVCLELETHLRTCEDCREFHDSLRKGHNAILKALPLLAPDRRYLSELRLKKLVESEAGVTEDSEKLESMVS